jgi:hypothetical protein
MSLLLYFFVVGLIVGIPVWIVWQFFCPGFARLSVAHRRDIVPMEIRPVVLNGHFVADVIKPLQ